MAKTWTIVIFTDEDSVEVVPSNWIVNDKCYWPSMLTSEKLKTAIKHHDAVNTSWPTYPIRLIRNGTFGKYIIITYCVLMYQLIKNLFIELS